MVVALDIGNTNIHAGLFRDGQLVKTRSFPVHPIPHLPRLTEWLGRQKLDGAGIASVIPDLTLTVARIFREKFRIRPLFLSCRLDCGFKFGYRDPRQMGADRIANLAGGLAQFPENLIVVSFGTATVIDAVFRNGYHPGGIILPGIGPALDVLAEKTAQLKRYPIRKPVPIVGRTTAECVQVGVMQGTALSVQGFIHRFRKIYKREFLCLATGGWARVIAPLIPEVDRVVPDLSIWGIYTIYRKNA